MADVRRIRKVWKAKPTIEGAGVHLKRVFGYHEVPQLDPFLLLDDFRSNDPAEYVTRTAASRRSRTCWRATWSTGTASGTAASSRRETCSG